MAESDNPIPTGRIPTRNAQPGDVLGIERGGETTSLGDTEEDEDRQRRELENPAADDQSGPQRTGVALQRSALGFRTRNQPS